MSLRVSGILWIPAIINFYEPTWCHVPEGFDLRSCCCEKLLSYVFPVLFEYLWEMRVNLMQSVWRPGYGLGGPGFKSQQG